MIGKEAYGLIADGIDQAGEAKAKLYRPVPTRTGAPKSVPTLAAAAQRHISRARGYRAQSRQRELDQVSCDLRRRLGVDVHLWQHPLEFLSIDQ